MDALESKQIGRYRVEIHYDDCEWDYLTSRDADNVGRLSVPGTRRKWIFQDDCFTYREAREAAGEPIMAIPLDIWSQSYTIVQEGSRDSADGFYWAPMSRAEEWDGDSAKMRACLLAELKVLSSELKGDIYGYVVVGPDGEDVDSCWGFIGGSDYAMSEGVSVAQWHDFKDACDWASVPEWVQNAVLIREGVGV